MLATLLPILLAAGSVLANPTPNLVEERAVNVCAEVKLVVNLLKLNGATPFCSQFLAIPTVTQTVAASTTKVITGVAPTVTVTSVTSTSTSTSTESTTETTSTTFFLPTPVVTTFTTTTVTSSSGTVTTTSTRGYFPAYPADVTARRRSRRRLAGDGTSSGAIEERGIPPIPLFLKAVASKAISTACGCLSIPTPTVRTTSTSTILTTTTPPVSTSTAFSVAGATTVTTTTSVQVNVITVEPSTSTSTSVQTDTAIVPAATETAVAACVYSPSQGAYVLDNGRCVACKTLYPNASGQLNRRGTCQLNLVVKPGFQSGNDLAPWVPSNTVTKQNGAVGGAGHQSSMSYGFGYNQRETLCQTVPGLTAGTTYQFSFWAASLRRLGTFSAQVVDSGSTTNVLYSTGELTNYFDGNINWVQFASTFDAPASGSVSICFAGQQLDSFGYQLMDDVFLGEA